MNVIKKINVDGVEYDIQGKELTKVTYAELKSLRDNGELVEGHLYRITDYEFTTVQANTKSAGHVFDIIVLATSANELSHIARAIAHEGDTYFDGNDLGAWEMWYDLDNDTDKYGWADAENGKGVIYRMIDEKRNDCPYDFKNALFYNDNLTTYTTEDKYYYTFSYVEGGVLYDGTVEKRVTVCYGNSMGAYITNKKRSLNRNVWRNIYFNSKCHGNTFDNDCNGNTLGSGCYNNSFGSGCNRNTLGSVCYNNSFGSGCYVNTLWNDCAFNNLQDGCNNNTLKDVCSRNILGNNCFSNILWNNCRYNIFGRNCGLNILSNDICHLTFGDFFYYRQINQSYTSLTFNDEYYDDGSGQLVPVKHPDLSTQPSILPYKFMGNYVYEQLIPMKSLSDLNSANAYIGIALSLVDNLIVLSTQAVIYKDVYGADVNIYFGRVSATLPVKLTCDNSLGYNAFKLEADIEDLKSPEGYDFTNPDRVYLRIVYTSISSESGDYGYGGVSVQIPHSGFVFKVPQSKGVTSIRYNEGGVDAIIIGSSNGYDYWYTKIPNVQVDSSVSFDITDGSVAVENLNAKVYKDGMTLVEGEYLWLFNAGSYYMSMYLMPDATWVFTEIQ